MRAAREMRFTGSVQGVGFRWTAKRVADSLGLSGWVRNDPDGGVSLVIEGEVADLDEFIEEMGARFGADIAEVRARDGKPGTQRGAFEIVR